MKTTRSRRLFARAQQLLPGGVDSPVRAFKSVGGSPLFVKRAFGATLVDVDGNKYIDYVMSWGPLIHGHAPNARLTKSGDPPTDLNARTGLSTPPGRSCCARAKRR